MMKSLFPNQAIFSQNKQAFQFFDEEQQIFFFPSLCVKQAVHMVGRATKFKIWSLRGHHVVFGGWVGGGLILQTR